MSIANITTSTVYNNKTFNNGIRKLTYCFTPSMAFVEVPVNTCNGGPVSLLPSLVI